MPPKLKFRPLVKPPLSEARVLAWVDAFRAQHGRFPKAKDGVVPGELTQTWAGVDSALRVGHRGLPGGDSLPRFMQRHRGHRNKKACPRLTVNQVLKWADAHHRQTGLWPKRTSGRVAESPGETWAAIDRALHVGGRGLRGGVSLANVLTRRRGVPNVVTPPPLTAEQVLRWADAWHTLYGGWPSKGTGPVGSTGETWAAVDNALRLGLRGMPGGSSLSLFLRAHGRFEGNKTPVRPRPGT